MSFDKILNDLESGKISAEQAKEQITYLFNDTINDGPKDGSDKGWYKTGIDCVMLRLGLKGREAII